MNRRIAFAAMCVAFVAIATACAGQSSEVSDAARTALVPVTTTTTTTPPSTTSTAPRSDAECLPSLPSTLPLPLPGDATGWLRDIYDRGYLIAGIDENTPGLGARDPRTAQFDGLEVELVREIAAAIFGDRDPDRVRFKTVVTKEKNKVVEDKEVDLTASADSITCAREETVEFSTEYLKTGHVLLVRTNDDITTLKQLAGHPVCVTAGSSSVGLLAKYLPTARPVEVDARNDCLVALQQGDADAYLGHTTFVRGMLDQDPDNLKILDGSLNDQHYGIAVAKDHPELVQFVNGVLQRMRDEDRFTSLFENYGLPITEIPR